MNSDLTTVEFVNVFGNPVDTTRRVKLEKRPSSVGGEYHKGWVVEGLPPGSMEAAMEVHARARATEMREGSKRVRPEWNLESWMQKAKATRVRTKAYVVIDAAVQCKEIAEKAGWLRVEIRALSKGGAA